MNLLERSQLIRGAVDNNDATYLADWLEENGDLPSAETLRIEQTKTHPQLIELLNRMFLPTELQLYGDFYYALSYASGKSRGGCGTGIPAPALPNDDIPCHPFDEWDIAHIIAAVEGENDESDWLLVGRLYDGRYFFLYAGCDYTGWG